MPSRKKGPASAAVSSAERVAVVGSGISGLSAAWLLQRAGKAVRGADCCPPAGRLAAVQARLLAAANAPAAAQVTLYESEATAGGRHTLTDRTPRATTASAARRSPLSRRRALP